MTLILPPATILAKRNHQPQGIQQNVNKQIKISSKLEDQPQNQLLKSAS